MAADKIESGSRAQVIAPRDVSSGEFIYVGGITGVALGDASEGEKLIIDTEGVFRLLKASQAISTGDRVFWDGSTKKINRSSGVFAGLAWSPAEAGAPDVAIRLSKDAETAPSSVVIVNQENYETKLAEIDPTKVYYLDGQVDTGNYQITVPETGFRMISSDFDTSAIISDGTRPLFVSPLGGSGNVLLTDLSIIGADVFGLTDSDGTHAIEMNRVNFINCASLGQITNYRQLLEDGTGRFGGSPELTLNGAMNGYRITVSITRGISVPTALFKAGAGLSFSGRFITDMNIDLPSTGAFFDFSPSNFVNNEALKIDGAFVTREGIIDAGDATIYPNIDHTSIKSKWANNVGLPNTTKYIKAAITSEVTTTINAADTYEDLAGVATVEKSSHFEQVGAGMEFRLLSGNGTYNFFGDFSIEGDQNTSFSIRAVKSSDDGISYTEINHVRRVINALTGGRDVGFVSISFIDDLKEGDRVKLEIENYDNTSNFTAELDSYFIISE